jgi:hypothetical protein
LGMLAIVGPPGFWSNGKKPHPSPLPLPFLREGSVVVLTYLN